MRLSEFAKLDAVSTFLERNNAHQSHRIGRTAEGDGLVARAVRQIMKSVGMKVS